MRIYRHQVIVTWATEDPERVDAMIQIRHALSKADSLLLDASVAPIETIQITVPKMPEGEMGGGTGDEIGTWLAEHISPLVGN